MELENKITVNFEQALTNEAEATREKSRWSEPHCFDLEKENDCESLEALINSGEIQGVYDNIELIADDLFDIYYPEQKDAKNPQDYTEFIEKIINQGSLFGKWFYFPWSGELVRYPDREDLRMLRTSRNKDLITAEEQERLYESTIAVFGLSVGSNVVESMLTTGVGGKFIIGDKDIIEPSNLNRIDTDFTAVGGSKVDNIAKKISKIDPYIEQVHINEGATESNIAAVIEAHEPSLVVDEIDDLPMKILIRRVAKLNKLPVLMAADNGEGTLVDIERYDTEDIDIFDGRIPGEVLKGMEAGGYSREQIGVMIGKYFVGTEHIPLRMYESLEKVGKTIPSWPQLGPAAAMSGAAINFAARRVLLDKELSTNRYTINFDEIMNPDIHTPSYQEKLQRYIDIVEKS